MLEKDIGKILEAALAASSNVRLKVNCHHLISLLQLSLYVQDAC